MLTDDEIRKIAIAEASRHYPRESMRHTDRLITAEMTVTEALRILSAAGYAVVPKEGLASALTKYDEQAKAAGSCSDGYCVVKRPKGMVTNGGCWCWKDKFKAQRMMNAGQQLAESVRAMLAALDQEKTGQ